MPRAKTSEPPKGAETEGTEASSEGPEGEAHEIDLDDLKSLIKETVQEVIGQPKGEKKEPDPKEPDPPATSERATQAVVERSTESEVRAAMQRVKDEEALQGRLETLETKVKESEAPPVQKRRSTRLMGW